MSPKYQNGQLCNECSLVTIWNAARFWGIYPVPKMGSQNYRKICRILGGFDEGCDDRDIEREMVRLGLTKKKGPFSLQWVRESLPVEFTLRVGHGKNRGLHSTLGVEVDGQRIRLLNYENCAKDRWIYWSQIKLMSGYYGWNKNYPISIRKETEGKRPVMTIKEMYSWEK